MVTLKQILEARKEEWSQKADPGVKIAYQEGIEAVVHSGLIGQAKQVGDQAPLFSLSNALGKLTRLEDYLAKGPVVLTWYRGGWCPYCNLTLQRLQQEVPAFLELGAHLVALTPELPDRSLSTTEKHALSFEVLSDVGNKVAKSYGIVFKLTDEVANIYAKNFNLAHYNGDNSNELPLSATYVIDKQGVIQFAFLDAEYRNRAEPAEIKKVLKEIQ